VSSVREKIEKKARDHWLEVKGDCAMLDFSHGAHAGYSLAIEEIRERAKVCEERGAHIVAGEYEQVATYLESLLESP
jgi:sugar phosphate isomerase/epimerase